jgi:hypothetical protein
MEVPSDLTGAHLAPSPTMLPIVVRRPDRLNMKLGTAARYKLILAQVHPQ